MYFENNNIDLCYVCVIKLENNKYFLYLSNTKDDDVVMLESSIMYDFVKQNKPIEIIQRLFISDILQYDSYVKMFMKTHGIDNVRGGSYSEVVIPNCFLEIIELELLINKEEYEVKQNKMQYIINDKKKNEIEKYKHAQDMIKTLKYQHDIVIDRSILNDIDWIRLKHEESVTTNKIASHEDIHRYKKIINKLKVVYKNFVTYSENNIKYDNPMILSNPELLLDSIFITPQLITSIEDINSQIALLLTKLEYAAYFSINRIEEYEFDLNYNPSDYEKKYDLAFYTCFYGSNDNEGFKIPELPSRKYDCYYFTNNLDMLFNLNGTKWIGIYHDKPVTDDSIESTMQSKEVKVIPHTFPALKKYNYTCYLDSKLRKLSDKFVEKYINNYFILEDRALILRQHEFIKDNVWNEYEESMKQDRYVKEKDKYSDYIIKQIESGLSATTSQHCACGFLIRNMNHPEIKELNNTWYSHIQECGIQDQISFFFVNQLFNKYIQVCTELPFVR